MPLRLVLASASTGRLMTLRRAGLNPEVIISGVDEDIEERDPARLALTLAVLKARTVSAGPAAEPPGPVLVLGCDSVLEFDGEIHGKPRDAADATARWRRMRGRSGVLHTGHCLIDLPSGREVARLGSTTVDFADLTDDEISAYVRTGEPLRVAGAFTLDGMGGAFVTRVNGDPHNVVGVSLPLVRIMLDELGYAWSQLWAEQA